MKKYLALLIVIAFTATSYAGDVSRKGTTGADQLLIPVSAQGIATGGAFVANYTGIESMYYNPAGLSLSNTNEAMFSYMSYIADINMSYFAASAQLGSFGTLGVNFKTLDFGDIPVTTAQNPDGTGVNYSPSFIVGGLSYSKRITDRVNIGVNTKLISESIMNASAVGVALDFGVQYSFGNNLRMGATVMNVGSNMQYTGKDLQTSATMPGGSLQSGEGVYEVETEPFNIPSYFELSLAYKYDFNQQNMMQFATTFRNNNALEDIMNFGLEYGFNNLFFIRGGYNLGLQEVENRVFGFAVGAGLNYDFTRDLNIQIDYAFRDTQEFPTSNHVMTVKLGLL